jgi:DNA-binding transcriptional LysR family regulator
LAQDLFASIPREFRSRFPMVEIGLSEMNSVVQIDALLREQVDVGLLRPIFFKGELFRESICGPNGPRAQRTVLNFFETARDVLKSGKFAPGI